MLRQLHIQNYAIIDEIIFNLDPRLNVVTGETGAGKSILAGALSLVLGDRADNSLLFHRDKKCVVEAFFSTGQKKDVEKFLLENELDNDQELLIRREISSSGKSRAFINDTPVTLEQVRKLSALLVDLHQQFDTLALGDGDFQMEVLDALAEQGDRVRTYQKKYQQWRNLQKELVALKSEQSQADKAGDYNQFLVDELNEAGFAEDEIEQAGSALKLMSHAEAIKELLLRAGQALQDSEQPIVQQLKSFYQQLSAYASYHPKLPELVARLKSVQIETEDIAGDLESVNNAIQYDAGKIEQLTTRLNTGYRLLKKHQVQTTAELLAVQDSLEQRLQGVLNAAEKISEMEKLLGEQMNGLKQLATTLSGNRRMQAPLLEEKVNALLKKVGMPNARLKLQLQDDEINPQGMNKVDFLFDANNGNRFEPIRKVASGGELSRLMLSIKSLVAKSLDMPTLLFDEIDSGISGEAARQVGIILKDLSRNRQVICITHQPQIAGKGDAHYFVFKEIRGEKIHTNIRLLGAEERITAIAKMLGGEKPTAAALENAKEMVTN
jgi:DNA repair protein RecN (Recombination protein N)